MPRPLPCVALHWEQSWHCGCNGSSCSPWDAITCWVQYS